MKINELKWKRSIFIAITFLSIFFSCSKENIEFDGSRTSNESQFILNFDLLNTTVKHVMELMANDTIDVIIRKESGELDLSVSDKGSEYIYKGDNVSTSEFSLIITQDDDYEFNITGRKASGFVSFIVRKKAV